MQSTKKTARKAATHVAKKLIEAGHETYFTGGCVRDTLLGTEPKDFDIATSATPEEVSALFEGSDKVGAHFGVIITKDGGHAIEIATFRTDGSYTDGRRPDKVEYATAKEDAFRRDFTINGMFENPLTGEIIDYVGGMNDIRDKKIRAIGSPTERFEEDGLRIMRAVRFATKLGFNIEQETLNGMISNSEKLDSVSVERLREEFTRILGHPNRFLGVQILLETRLIDKLIPEFSALEKCEQSPTHHPEGNVLIHTMMMVENLKEDASPELALATMLHDIGKPATFQQLPCGKITAHGHEAIGAEISRKILNRMKYSTNETDKIVGLVEKHMKPHAALSMRKASIRRMLGWEHYKDLLELHRLDCLCSNKNFETYELLTDFKEKLGEEPALPPRMVTGRDLIDRGMTPGPAFREILEAAQTEQLEGRMETTEDAKKWLVTNVPLKQGKHNMPEI